MPNIMSDTLIRVGRHVLVVISTSHSAMAPVTSAYSAPCSLSQARDDRQTDQRGVALVESESSPCPRRPSPDFPRQHKVAPPLDELCRDYPTFGVFRQAAQCGRCWSWLTRDPAACASAVMVTRRPGGGPVPDPADGPGQATGTSRSERPVDDRPARLDPPPRRGQPWEPAELGHCRLGLAT